MRVRVRVARSTWYQTQHGEGSRVGTHGEPTKFQHDDDDVVKRTTRRRQSCQQRSATQRSSLPEFQTWTNSTFTAVGGEEESVSVRDERVTRSAMWLAVTSQWQQTLFAIDIFCFRLFAIILLSICEELEQLLMSNCLVFIFKLFFRYPDISTINLSNIYCLPLYLFIFTQLFLPIPLFVLKWILCSSFLYFIMHFISIFFFKIFLYIICFIFPWLHIQL